MECEFTVTRLRDGAFYLVFAATAESHHLDWLRGHLPEGADVTIENITVSRGVSRARGPPPRGTSCRG